MSIERIKFGDTWVSQSYYDPLSGWDAASMQLYRLHLLQSDWDGEGAIPPDVDAINNAFWVLSDVKDSGGRPPTRVLADPDGAVLLKWQEGATYIEIEVSSSDTYEWVIIDEAQGTMQGESKVPSMEGGEFITGERAIDITPPDSSVTGEYHVLCA